MWGTFSQALAHHSAKGACRCLQKRNSIPFLTKRAQICEYPLQHAQVAYSFGLPVASLLIIGTKYSSISSVLWCSATARSESTALSLTTVSSTVARLSSGGLGGGGGGGREGERERREGEERVNERGERGKGERKRDKEGERGRG